MGYTPGYNVKQAGDALAAAARKFGEELDNAIAELDRKIQEAKK